MPDDETDKLKELIYNAEDGSDMQKALQEDLRLRLLERIADSLGFWN